jgi:Ser/Thr protein kinase RdoA (MazF antagonist)
MTPFAELTPAGQQRRLRRVVAGALERYEIGEHRVSLLATSFNTVYRVSSARGTFVLRVGPEHRIHRSGAARAEAEWTAHLAACGLRVPQVVATRAGTASTEVSIAGVPGARECVLLTWTAGYRLRCPISVKEVREIAVLCARLHATPDARAQAGGALDGRLALLFEIPNRLGSLRADYGPLFAEALRRAQRALDDLWRHAPCPPRLLHGDLNPGNVLRTRRGLTAIDFQDVTWGHEQQDLANTLFGIVRDDHDGELFQAFRSSYAEHRAWPDLDETLLADLFAVRRLMMVNLALERQRGRREYVSHHARALHAYLQDDRTRSASR